MTLGTLTIVSAPSGAGKTSLLQALVDVQPQTAISVSHTTRPKRPGERDGEHYHFVEEQRFVHMMQQGAFLEHANVFGNFYGTSQAAVSEQLTRGLDVIVEIDWQGARQVRKHFPDAESIFILPPSPQTLRERLSARGQDDEATIKLRMREAVSEMSHFSEFDFLVVNDDFDRALQQLRCIVTALGLRRTVQRARIRDKIEALLKG